MALTAKEEAFVKAFYAEQAALHAVNQLREQQRADLQPAQDAYETNYNATRATQRAAMKPLVDAGIATTQAKQRSLE